MTVFESISSKNIDEFAVWLHENVVTDEAPWITWWDNNFCKNCDSEVALFYPDSNREAHFAWCELYDKCRFFQHMSNVPDGVERIKMWLESEEVKTIC